MSVQDTIAGQNLSEGNARTALEMIKLQAENMRANQRAGVSVRGQDIEREQNQAGNALEQQKIDETSLNNAFNRYATERRLSNEDKAATRSDYQVYNQGDRALANQEQQTANALELGRGAQSLTARGQDITMRGQDMDLEKAAMQNQTAQQSVALQAEQIQMAKKVQELKQAKEQFYQDTMKTQGLEGLLSAYESSGDSNMVNSAANLRRTLQGQQEYNQIASDKARLKHSEDFLAAYNNAQSPEDKGAAVAAYQIATGIPEDAKPEAVVAAAKNQVVTISRALGNKMGGGDGQVDPMTQQYIANMFGRKENGQPNVSGVTSMPKKLSKSDQKIMDGYIEAGQKAENVEMEVDKFGAAYEQLPPELKGTVMGAIGQKVPSVVDAASWANSNKDYGGTQLREIDQVAQVLGGLNKFDSQSSAQETSRLMATTPTAGTPPAEVEQWMGKSKAVLGRIKDGGIGAEKWIAENGSLDGYKEAREEWANENPLFNKDGSVIQSNINMPITAKEKTELEEIKRLEAENAALRNKKGK